MHGMNLHSDNSSPAVNVYVDEYGRSENMACVTHDQTMR